MLFFDRKVKVTIGEAGQTGKEIKDLTILFVVKENTDSAENSAEIQIYNLSKETRGFLEKKEMVVFLEAGYGDVTKRIFTGITAEKEGIKHEKQGNNWITTIKALDGRDVLKVKVSQSFAPKVKASQIINYLIAQMGLVTGKILGVPEFRYNQGRSIVGFARDEMDKITQQFNLQWYIQGGAVYILPQGTNTGEQAVLISKETGMIDAPIKNDDGVVEVKSLLNPEIKAGRVVEIKSNEVNGQYKVNVLQHVGSSRQGQFYTICKELK